MTDNITFDEYERFAFENGKPETQGHRLSLRLQAAFNYSCAKELRSGKVIDSRQQMLGIANAAAAMMAILAEEFKNPSLVAACCDELANIIDQHFDELTDSLIAHGYMEVSN